MGDLKPAIEQHEILYQVTKKHNFLPEAITADFQVNKFIIIILSKCIFFHDIIFLYSRIKVILSVNFC